MEKIKAALHIIWLPVLGASLCCLSPLILLIFGVVSVGVAADLADLFYLEWKWAFRGAGLLLLLIGLGLHFRRKGVCTLDQAKRHRNEILNALLISLTLTVLGYLFFLYVVVHYWGVWLGIWA